MKFPKHLLAQAANLNIQESELKLAYYKGFNAWQPGKVPGSTPEQLGFAVVEQFLQIKYETTLVEAQPVGSLDTPPPVNQDPVEIDDNQPKKKEKKKHTSYKDFAKDKKYSNKQPTDIAPSGRGAGGSGGANFYQSEDVLPDNTNIRAWAMSEKTQSDYTKRYGKRASERLLEAAKTLHGSLSNR